MALASKSPVGLFLTLDLLLAAVRMIFFKVVLFLTLGKAKRWYQNNSPEYIYIYICLRGRLPPQKLVLFGKVKLYMFNISAV